MFFEITLIVITSLILLDYLKKIHINKILKANGVDGSKLTLPLIGDIILTLGLNVKNLVQFLKRMELKYGKVYRVWCFNKCLLFVQDVNYVESILSSSRLIKKPFFYDQLSLWLGNGLLLSNSPKWQKRRKMIAPTFTIKILEQFLDIFDQHAHGMVDKLRPLANGATVIDIFPLACSTMLDIFLETAMGVKLTTHSADCLAYMEAVTSISHIAGARFLKPLQHYDFTFKLMWYKTYRKLHENVKIVHGFTEKLINARRAELMSLITDGGFENENERDEIGIKKHMTFLDHLLQSTIDGKPPTNGDIREEVDNFTFGGHDTTSSAISFTLYLIARHPQVQEKVIEEILRIIGPDKTKPAGMKELQDLKYLECVIKESMRLYPPAPAIARIIEEDHKIGDTFIPRNTNIIMLIYAICRDPDNFPQPNDFIPERFASANIAKMNPYAYIPFSAGPRNCIGQKYAMLEMKSVVSCLLRNYELLPLGPAAVIIITVIMRSETGVNIGLKPRDY